MSLTKAENKILRSITIASENDPGKPEFPPHNPKFPASPTRRIEVSGFENVWLKDESVNPTGTHKDRMAWEIVVTYRDFLLAKKNNQFKGPLPHMSLISSGSAAFAIQNTLNVYHLPQLKVLVGKDFDGDIADSLLDIGCEIFETDLGKKPLAWHEILKLTHNAGGFDITSNEALGPTTRFYDWMSYEIINSSPDYCFIPFGTGNLYENVLNVTKKEVTTRHRDPRFKGKLKHVRSCNFMGATTNNPNSKADKLYSPHLPFVHYDEQWIRLYRSAGYCGPDSDVYLVKEEYIDEALKIFADQKVSGEASGVAGLALMLQMKKHLPRNKKMLIVNTGRTTYSEV